MIFQPPPATTPRPRTAMRVAARLRRAARIAAAPQAVLAAAALVIPWGSMSAFQQHIVDGSVVDAVPQSRVLRWAADDRAHAMYQVAAVKRHPPQRVPVYLFGGSSMRECIVSATGLREDIRERCGVDTRVVSLASIEEKPAAILAMVDNLPAVPSGIVVIGVHHPLFAHGIGSATRQLHGDEILVRSTALRDFLEARLDTDLSANLGRGITTYLEVYQLRRGVPAFRGGPLRYSVHRYPQWMTLSAYAKRQRVKDWLEGRGRPNGPFFRNFGLGAALIEETIRIARAKGYQVLLMESSQNEEIIGTALDPYRTRYRALGSRMVDEYGAHYANLNLVAGLVTRDFYDLVHLHPSGARKWQPRLAETLAQVLVDHSTVTGPSPAAWSPTEERPDTAGWPLGLWFGSEGRAVARGV